MKEPVLDISNNSDRTQEITEIESDKNPYWNNNSKIEKLEIQNNNVVLSINDELKKGFIKKVYGIFTVQILITILISLIGFIHEVNEYFQKNNWPGLTFGIISLVILMFLMIFRNLSKKVPINYVLLFMFTITNGLYLAYAFARVNDWKTIVTAATMTFSVCTILTIYSFSLKLTTDFSKLNAILLVLIVCTILLGLFSIFFNSYFKILICSLGVFLFGVYLVIDTQLIIGNLGISYSVDDYIFAALSIYNDVFQIFLYLLRILK